MEPPLEAGAAQLMSMVPLPTVAVSRVGALGTDPMVHFAEELDGPSPTELLAETKKKYWTPWSGH